MHHNHQRLRSWWTIHESQQGSRASGTANQGRNLDLKGLTLIDRQINGTERVPQGLEVATPPGKTLLKWSNPQLLQQLRVWVWIRPTHN
jgi:hypothetical protein